MSSSVQLFDEKGELLPPEKCNIAPLQCITKDRVSAYAERRTPTRNGKPLYNAEGNIKLKDTAVKEESRDIIAELRSHIELDLKSEKEFNTTDRITSHSAESSPIVFPDAAKTSSSHLLKKKRQTKMRSSEEGSSEELELSEKPIPLWTTEDVCIWLEFVDLQTLKDHFISHKVTGKTLLNLNYETLENLNLSNSSEERENFLGAVYELQQEHEEHGGAEHELNKENEAILLQQSREQNAVNAVLPSQNGSNSSSGKSLALSSQASSEHGHSPTKEKITTSEHAATSNSQHKPPKQGSKTAKESSKETKKRRSRTKRISRLWSSFQGHKNSSVIDNAPEAPAAPFYKNVFHNLMNTGPQGVIKVWTEMFLTDMQYVSLLVRHETTAADAVRMVLEKSNAHEDPECYRICEINEKQNEYTLNKTECPLQRERQWSDPDNCRFELRWRNERLVEWSGPGEASDVLLLKPDQNNTQVSEQASGDETNATTPTSPELDNSKQIAETALAYNIEVEYKKEEGKTQDNNSSTASSGGPERGKPSEMIIQGQDATSSVDGAGMAANELKRDKTSIDKNDVSSTSNGTGLADDIFKELGKDKNVVDKSEILTTTDQGKSSKAKTEVSITDEGKHVEDRSEPSSTENIEPGSLMRAHKQHLTSSCPDLTSKDLFEGEAKVSSSSEGSGTDDDDEHERTFEDEREYSQRLRTSSKNLSWRLKLKIHERPPAEGLGTSEGNQERIGTNEINEGHLGTVGDNIVAGSGGKTSRDNFDEAGISPNSVQDVITDGDSEIKKESDVMVESSPDGEVEKDSSQVTQADISKGIAKLEARVKEVEAENQLLLEDNRELKKSCRTFEGRSRLKEREMEEMEEEKDGMSSQMKEMVNELHLLRSENAEFKANTSELKKENSELKKENFEFKATNAELKENDSEFKAENSEFKEENSKLKAESSDLKAKNTELKAELDEANTKLGDVDGWVTRDVFEEIRGQLSLSSEEVETKDEEMSEMVKTMDGLKTENKKIAVLEAEIETLNEGITEDKECIEGLNRDLKDREKQIQNLKTDIQKRRASFKKSEQAKEELVNRLKETENEVNEGVKKHADARKDMQKRLSDREYEILIMKEEKKELCAKLKSLEGNIESLQEELKKKDVDHEAVIAEMKEQSDIKDESLSVTVTTLEQLANERDQRIMQLKKQLAAKSQGEQEAKAHEYEQNKLYLKHLIALVREKDPKLLELLNKTLKSKDKDDWC